MTESDGDTRNDGRKGYGHGSDRRDDGHRGDRRGLDGGPYSKKPYSGKPGQRKPYRDRDDRGEGHKGRPRSDGDGDRRGSRPRYDRRYSGKDRSDREDRGNGQRKPYRDRDDRRDGDRHGRRDDDGQRKPYHGKDDRREGYRDRDSGDRPRDRKGGYGKGGRDGDRRREGYGQRKPYQNKGGDRRDGNRYERRDGYRSRDPGNRDGPAEAPKAQAPAPAETRLTIPSTPQKILFKGIDCEVNGKNTLALVLYLHGAAQMSEGCEKNALRMLGEMGASEFPTVRGRVADSCTDEAMVALDYLCLSVDPSSDRSRLDSAATAGDPFAAYCRIRLEEIEGDDPIIDTFASAFDTRGDMVEKGLKLLVRKKDSAKAEDLLKSLEKRKKLRQSVRQVFVRASKGDKGAVKELDALAAEFPEAGFLRGYLDCGDRVAYIRSGMPEHSHIIMSVVSELGISDTPYGMYLAAKRAQSEGGEWVPPMIKAAAAGSEEAVEDLRPVQSRKDVRTALSSAYATKGNVEGLVKLYDGDDATHLDRYCGGDPARILEVGRLLRGTREIDWLKRGALDGVEECRAALVSMSHDEARRCKQLVYTLHDVGADVDAARLYMDMYGDPTLPSVKWLGKVCADEDAKEVLRSRFEAIGDLATFDSIFVDDGYDDRHRASKGGRGGDRRKGGKRDGRGYGRR